MNRKNFLQIKEWFRVFVAGTLPRALLSGLVACILLSLLVSGGNVIVRNGQLNVSAGIYGDSGTFYIDSENDRVGIGTTSPIDVLTVVGNIGLRPAGSAYYTLASTQGGSIAYGIYQAGGDDLLRFKAFGGNDNILVLKSNGNVGVGTTSPDKIASETGAGGPILNVNGSFGRLVAQGVNGARLDLVDSGGGSDDKWMQLFTDEGVTKFRSINDSGATLNTDDILVMDMGTGNVGIGIASPAQKLDVNGNISINNNRFYTAGSTDNNHFIQWNPPEYEDYSGNNNQLVIREYGAIVFAPGNTPQIIFNTSGNVGIGTTGPIAKLDVARTVTNTVSFNDENNTAGVVVKGSDANVRLQLGVGGATLGPYAGWIQASYDNVASEGSEPLLLNPMGGNVGIGTTSPSSWGKLTIAGDLVFANEDTDYIISGPANGGAIRIRSDSDEANRYLDLGLINNEEVFSSKITINNSGNVGIGTTSPSYPLHVKGSNSGTMGIIMVEGNYSAMQHKDDAGNLRYLTGLRQDVASNLNYVFYSYGGNWVFTNGYVGIGTTDPGVKLDVVGGGMRIENGQYFMARRNTSDATINVLGFESETDNLFLRTGGSAGSSRFGIIRTDDTEIFTVLNSGYLGIGTTSPQKLLHLNATGSEIIRIDRTSDANVDSIFSIGVSYTAQNDDYLYLGRTSTVDIVLTDDGNVGIQTTSPDHDLEIGTGTYSEIDAGEAQFTTGSSREYKENITEVTVEDILGKIGNIPVNTYDFKEEYCNETDGSCDDKIGLIAEDFYTIFGRGSDKELSGQEVQMALWLAVQELKEENDLKDAEILELRRAVCELNPGAAFCAGL